MLGGERADSGSAGQGVLDKVLPHALPRLASSHSGMLVWVLASAPAVRSPCVHTHRPGVLSSRWLHVLPQVREQRVSNLLQSLLVAACLGITPAIQQIPTGVLWGYFIFMAVESLAGSQLWERLLLLVTDPKKRVAIMQQEHAAYMQVRAAPAGSCC